MLETHQDERVEVVGVVANVDEALSALQALQPDLVVVDYDDGEVNREEFLRRFVESEHRLRVVLLSLKEGGSNALVYDRQTMAASKINDWLHEWKAIPQSRSDAKKERNRFLRSEKQSMQKINKHFLGVMVFVILLTIFGLIVLRNDILLPVAASEQALPIDRLFKLEFQATAVLFGAIIGAILYSVIFFRRKAGDTEDPVYTKGDRSLNITWMIVPVGALFFFVILNVSPMFESFYNSLIPNTLFTFPWAAGVLSALLGLVMYFVLFGLKSSGAAQEETAKGNDKLELAWIALPLGLVLLLSFAGSDVLAQTLRIDPDPLVVNVTAQQWSWQFEYPENGLVTNELVLPVNKQVLFKMNSVDVLHSFWVPEFRVKQDVVPGEEKELRITPSKVGEFTLMCAEICGTQHSYMNTPVIVKSAQDFESWIISQSAPISDDPVERGKVWFKQFGCNSCHSIDGKEGVGPTLKGINGSEVYLEDGTEIEVDETFLYESIQQPGKTIVKGFSNIMPASSAKKMTDEQIWDLVAYIMSLK